MFSLQLAIVQQGGRLLLGLKKTGFGAGYYNGFGGKVEPGESIEEAAYREVCGFVMVHKCGITDRPHPSAFPVLAAVKRHRSRQAPLYNYHHAAVYHVHFQLFLHAW